MGSPLSPSPWGWPVFTRANIFPSTKCQGLEGSKIHIIVYSSTRALCRMHFKMCADEQSSRQWFCRQTLFYRPSLNCQHVLDQKIFRLRTELKRSSHLVCLMRASHPLCWERGSSPEPLAWARVGTCWSYSISGPLSALCLLQLCRHRENGRSRSYRQLTFWFLHQGTFWLWTEAGKARMHSWHTSKDPAWVKEAQWQWPELPCPCGREGPAETSQWNTVVLWVCFWTTDSSGGSSWSYFLSQDSCLPPGFTPFCCMWGKAVCSKVRPYMFRWLRRGPSWLISLLRQFWEGCCCSPSKEFCKGISLSWKSMPLWWNQSSFFWD